MIYTLTLPADAVQVVSAALQGLPYRDVAPTIAMIAAQVQQQQERAMQPPPPPAGERDPGKAP